MNAGGLIEGALVAEGRHVLPIAANDPDAERGVQPLIDGVAFAVGGVVVAEGIADDDDQIGLFTIEDAEHLAFAAADAVGVNVTDCGDFYGMDGGGNIVVGHLNPAG